jgi:hypothetical protein
MYLVAPSLSSYGFDFKSSFSSIAGLAKIKKFRLPSSSAFKRQVGSAALDFIPIVGNLKSGLEAIVGKDLVTGQKLSVTERLIAGVGIFTGGLGKSALKGASAGLGFAFKASKGTGKKIHGNSLDTPKPTDLYVVRERRTGEIIRFGETTQGYKKRGQQHARRFSKLGIEVETTLLKGGLSKREAKALETRYIRSYEKVFGNKPPYNKSYH